ncbi:hypothetical protein [Streptomyces kanasensis]|nr:hypothetical protein [Streptomyces kanasensis]
MPRAKFAETWWAKGGRTGRAYPRGTEVCMQHKGVKPRTCLALK